MSTDAFETIMASLDVPLVVVTTAADDERGGCLVGFHAQSSIEPARYCVWLSKANHTTRLAQRSSHLAVHYLTAADFSLAELFGGKTGDTTDKFAGLRTTTGPHGVPLVTDLPNRIVVRRLALLDEGGDHLCVTVEPVQAHSSGPFVPLRLSDAEGIVPGHENDERPSPPTERAG